MLAILSALFAGVFILVGVLLFYSYPGKPYLILDEKGKPLPGSLSEKVFIEINGSVSFNAKIAGEARNFCINR